MKKILFVASLAIFSISSSAQEHPAENSSMLEESEFVSRAINSDDVALTLADVCSMFHIPNTFSFRRWSIIEPLRKSDVTFPWKGAYTGTAEQNKTLKLAILANPELLETILKGKISMEDLKAYWNWDPTMIPMH